MTNRPSVRYWLVQSGAGSWPEQGRSERAKDWARAALAWTNVHVSWTVTEDKIRAKALEERILIALDEHDLWNRLRPRLQ
jgi:hypothetical protein